MRDGLTPDELSAVERNINNQVVPKHLDKTIVSYLGVLQVIADAKAVMAMTLRDEFGWDEADAWRRTGKLVIQAEGGDLSIEDKWLDG